MKCLLSIFAAAAAVWFALRWLVGFAPRGRALRPVLNPIAEDEPPPPAQCPNSERWYVESTEQFGGLPYSCSFVEFDERGDYLDFHQHRHAYQKIRELTEAAEPLVLVIFVHGWRNNCQSGNVTSFNFFLSQLASAPSNTKRRIHGVYIGWRGAVFRHGLDENDPHYVATTRHFGDRPLVDLEKYAARVPWLAEAIETLSYWNRKSVPEYKFAGTALSRTIFTCAHMAKQKGGSGVFLMGHSFGGLMLERSVQNAALGELIDAWPWSDTAPREPNPLPFDMVLLLNTASPSIYAKQFQSCLAAHRAAMLRPGPGRTAVGTDAPIYISPTSEADWATGLVHPFGNCLAPFVPTLQHDFRADDFILDVPKGTAEPWIPQAEYYVHTPGHNPLLVNRFIEPLGENSVVTWTNGSLAAASLAGVREKNILHENLAVVRFVGAAGVQPRAEAPRSSFVFQTSAFHNGGAPDAWALNMPPEDPANKKWSSYGAYRPIAWNRDHREIPYWIVRCPKEIIAGHTDIWNIRAMETYAALYRIAEELRS